MPHSKPEARWRGWVDVVEDATSDVRFRDNPLVTADPHIRFYAGVQRRTPDGHALGTLCAIDRKPRSLTTRQMELLGRLALQVEVHLELRRRTLMLERELRAARTSQANKEHLAAMLVHDLRNPLAGIALAAEVAPGMSEAELQR